MLLLPHLLAGTVVSGSLATGVWTAGLYSFLTYFVIELIPHWDPRNSTKKIVQIARYLDFILASVSLFFLIYVVAQPGSVLNLTVNGLAVKIGINHFVGGIVSFIFYIIVQLGRTVLKERKYASKIFNFVDKIKYIDRSIWGIIIQIAIPILAITILFRLVDFPSLQRILIQLGN